MRKLHPILLFLLLVFGGQLSAQTVVDIIINSEAHNTLEAAVIAAGLDDDLSGDGPFTVFAPTDDAFAALPAGTIETLLADPAGLATILTYHVVGDSARSNDLSNGQVLTSLQGDNLLITKTDAGIFVNGVMITVADIPATNGVVHVIDAVLSLPPATVVDIVVASEVHTTLEAAVIAADLAGALSGDGPFTIFAPTDDAFAALPAGTVDALLADIPTLTSILTYHVVGAEAYSGGLSSGDQFMTLNGSNIRVTISDAGVFINDAQVTVTDIIAGNGVVHVINAVLTPPPATVVDIIVASEVHTTLEAAVIAADLAGALSGDGPFTVFAPTDDAFAALPAGTVDALLADIPTLTSILTYHVVGAEAFASDLSNGDRFMTLNGSDVRVTISDAGVFINDAQVIVTDLVADNGIVHVINAVLTPPPATVVDIIVASEVHTTLEAAVIAADLTGALSGDGPFTVFAPTDAAFNLLDDGVLEDLLLDPGAALTTILQFHVASGDFFSADLSDGMMITSLEGQDLNIAITADGITVEGVNISVTDILADNGVVHVIDAVMIPISVSTAEPAFASEVRIMPNPASSFTQVHLPVNILQNTELTLRDMTGRTLLQRQATSTMESLDLSAYPSGTYLLQIQAKAGTIQRQIIVQR